MSTSKSRAATTSTRAASPSRRRASTTASCSTARRAAACESWAQVADVVKSGSSASCSSRAGSATSPARASASSRTPKHPRPVDFNLWLGPAPEHAFNANLVHYNWHWFWDFGNGDIGNQGVHQMDIARWVIPGATLPKSVVSLGGRFGYKDQGETPNTQISLIDFGDTQLIFEVRGLETRDYKGQKVGNIFHFEEGTIAGNKFYPKGKEKPREPLPKVDAGRGPGEDGHFGNFIAAVRSRKVTDLNADILEGHYSSALCHLANISYRLGEQVPFNPQTKAFGDNKEAYETLERMEEYLTKNNGLNLDGLEYRLGRKLTVDAKRSRSSTTPKPTSC